MNKMVTRITASRYHDFSAGHRVMGHENKCRNLHGHNYRVTFTVEAENLDAVGRVLDFSVIKELLCEWLEQEWDHKFLVFVQDYLVVLHLKRLMEIVQIEQSTIVEVPFNPTAENMGHYLLNVIGPKKLAGTGVRLVAVSVEETRKCAALAVLDD